MIVFVKRKGGRILVKIIQIKEKLNFVDIWKIQNPKTKLFTFREHHATRFIHRKLDYFFKFNQLQETVRKTNILAAFTCNYQSLLQT